MKGKIGLVVGLGVGYVLGTRAGRERYEQIKVQWLKVWNLPVVQEQVGRAQDFAKSQAAAVPRALWNGAVKLVGAVSESGTPGQKLDSAIKAGSSSADEVRRAAEETVEAAEEAAQKADKAAKAEKPAKPRKGK